MLVSRTFADYMEMLTKSNVLNIYCAMLRKHRTRWFGCHFLNGLSQMKDQSLDNVIGFVIDLNLLCVSNFSRLCGDVVDPESIEHILCHCP